MTRYVQSRYSKDALRWEVLNVLDNWTDPKGSIYWCVRGEGGQWVYLPKSEYVEVEALETWDDVTAECEIEYYGRGGCQVMHGMVSRFIRSKWGEHYRLRKVQGKSLNAFDWAFIIERRTEGGQP